MIAEWLERRRERRADNRRAWFILLGTLTLPDDQKADWVRFVRNLSTDDVLCKGGEESDLAKEQVRRFGWEHFDGAKK